ncbi:MAG: RNA polymerase sigma factor [Flammeovirgaceae bacterium]|nr:RNA polymerase sigma factor [Flammeovirgaceae bacterium]
MNALQQYQKEFISFQSELKAFIYRLVTHHQDTEDIMQDTYIKVFKNIETFKGNSTFKTWVFSIATNRAKDHLRSQSRWKEEYQDNCRTATYASKELQQTMANISLNSPHGKFDFKEHIDYCFTCMSKTLLLEEQVCIILKEVYSFKVSEIMEIINLSEGKVKHALANARKRFLKIFEGRCALIHKNGVCHQCTELNGIFNPQQAAEEKLMKIKMVKERENTDIEKLLDLRFQLVSKIDPINAEGFDLHNYMLETLPIHST